MNPLGLTLPIKIGRNGYFDQSYDTLSQIKFNIINLLNTKRGERPLNPNFGSSLYNYIFEQNIVDTTDILKQVIQDDINRFVPGVVVNFVDINVSENKNIDNYIIKLSVNFTVNNTSDSVTVNIQNNRI